MKIIDIIEKRREEKKFPLFSFEYFPPKTEKGVENLYERLDRMSLLGPSWIDITWGAGGSTSDISLEICSTAQNLVGLETMMHLTCTNVTKEKIREVLAKMKGCGMQNVLALRGDPPRGQEWKEIEGGFPHAIDLIKFIRSEYGDYFGICVAGFPETHPDATSYEDDLKYLKEKIDAGADLIITQLFYDTKIFLKYVNDCRKIGITCPIIPGLMPLHTYASFERLISLSKTKIPEELRKALEPMKNDDEAVKSYGVKLCMEMCRELLANGVECLHFYTMNLERSVTLILEGLGLLDTNGTYRRLPWRSTPALTTHRGKEDVRPIFWKNRPKSYLQRTQSWDEFPNGRWGDARSPAFGELSDNHLMSLHVPKSDIQNRGKIWGSELTNEAQLEQVFVNYLKGDIPCLPWCDTPLSHESDPLIQDLMRINKSGFLTINSQPAVNGAPSTTENIGWGPKGGFIYQKAYVEFFTSPSNLEKLLKILPKYPSITYHALNLKGDAHTNAGSSTNALTWGVFPAKEIVQPTVVDHDSFVVWKDEAFAIWKSSWLPIYNSPEKSSSREFLDGVISSYYLVNMVENNYVNGNIFAPFNELISGSDKVPIGKQEF